LSVSRVSSDPNLSGATGIHFDFPQQIKCNS
jgi:hypothetical protein